MEHELDIDRLRDDLMDNYGTAMFNASPMAAVELAKVERMSDGELVRLAQKNGMDLDDYID